MIGKPGGWATPGQFGETTACFERCVRYESR